MSSNESTHFIEWLIHLKWEQDRKYTETQNTSCERMQNSNDKDYENALSV